MGWGATAKQKRVICASVRETIPVSPSALSTVDGVVVDVNAILRTRFGYTVKNEKMITPRMIIRQFMTWILEVFPYAHHFIFCFDSGHLIPQERKSFYATRRYAPTNRAPRADEVKIETQIYKRVDVPLTPEEIETITMDHMPENASGSSLWSRVWNSAEGKTKLWQALAMSLQHYWATHQPTVLDHLRGGALQCIVDMPDGKRVFYPACVDTNAWTQWGEADTKCYQWCMWLCAQYPQQTIVFETIDWDAYMQVMVAAIPNLIVHIGKIYKHGELEYYSNGASQKAEGKGVPTHELIVCRLLPTEYGGRLQRLHAMFWCLCCGGVDYCRGLGRFGYTETCIQPFLTTQQYAQYEFFEEDNGTLARQLHFQPWAFIQALKAIAIKRVKKNGIDWEDFSNELQNILFCVCYYLGWDPCRERGGPLRPEEPPILSTETKLLSFLDESEVAPQYTLRETHPATAAMMTPQHRQWLYGE